MNRPAAAGEWTRQAALAAAWQQRSRRHRRAPLTPERLARTEGRAFALRLPALGEAMLFVEIESGTDELTTGLWLSVHDRQWAEQWRFDVQRQFQRVIRAASSG
jgi:hypothetical protein